MESATGLGANAIPNLNNSIMLQKLMRGMMSGEGTGGFVPQSRGVTINGGITINSPHADPAKVADEIPRAMQRYSMLMAANTGLT